MTDTETKRHSMTVRDKETQYDRHRDKETQYDSEDKETQYDRHRDKETQYDSERQRDTV